MSATDSSRPSELMQMSVHTLPQGQPGVAHTWSGRLKMLLIWAVCAAPVVASYLAYYVFKPEGRTNHGDLIMPPRSVPSMAALPLTQLSGDVLNPEALKGQWLLVSVAGAQCDQACEQRLYVQRQLREVLGREKDRLDRVWLVSDQHTVRPELLPALKDSWVLRVSPEALAQWLQPAQGQSLADHLYLVDPRGDWMMRFDAHAEPSGIKKDLMRLLKSNESWDEPGR